MMIMRKISFLLLISLVLSTSASGQNITKVGTSAAKFLSIPVGARGVSLGGAFVARADGPSAMYWNPAGITKMHTPEMAVSHSEWFEGIDFEHVGMVYPMGELGSFGIQAVGFKTDDMEVTTESAQEGTGEFFNAASYALGATYARQLTVDFAIGFTAKYIREQIYHTAASALAVDIGVTYNTPMPNTVMGFSISNFGQKMQMRGEDLLVNVDIDPTHSGNNEDIVAMLLTDKFDLPLLLRIGFATELIRNEMMSATVSIDALHPNDNTESINAGVELSFADDMVFLRGGVNVLGLEDRQSEFSFGGGLRYPLLGNLNMAFDYVYESHKYLGNINTISLGIRF